MEYKISVIVPVYNVENYIERCVRSLFEQTLQEGVEYIFVDDCSPDRSMQVIEAIASEYPERLKHIRIIHQSLNSGSSAARNSGLAIAQGEYIYFADSDDWAEKEMLAVMYQAAKENDADIVRCDYFTSYSTYEIHEKQKDETDPIKCVKLLLSEQLHGAFWNKLVRKTLYTDHEIVFCDGYWEDMLAFVQLFYYAKKIVYIPQAFYHYVQYNPYSQGSENLEKKLAEIVNNTNRIIEFLQDKNLHVEKQIHFIKVAAKQTLLYTCDKSAFRKWLQIYPESNRYIWFYPSLPFHLRMVGGFTSIRLWPLIDCWIWVKKMYRKRWQKIENSFTCDS